MGDILSALRFINRANFNVANAVLSEWKATSESEYICREQFSRKLGLKV